MTETLSVQSPACLPQCHCLNFVFLVFCFCDSFIITSEELIRKTLVVSPFFTRHIKTRSVFARERERERDGGVRMVRLDSGVAARDLRYHHTTSQSCAPASTAPFDSPLSHDLHHHRCHQRYRPRNCSVLLHCLTRLSSFVVSFLLL